MNTTPSWKKLSGASFFLEGLIEGNNHTWRTPLKSFPFLIGRRADADLVLPSARVSHRHAEIRRQHGRLWIEDLGSTNGTFVDGRRINCVSLIGDGTIIHFANQEFRLVILKRGADTAGYGDRDSTEEMTPACAPSDIFGRMRHFKRMLSEATVISHFQPVVDLQTTRVQGYEMLGRGLLDGMLTYPAELFRIAEALDLEVELSAALRTKGLAEAEFAKPDQTLFLNVHPAELLDQGAFCDTLFRVREHCRERPVVVEIHENAVSDLYTFSELRQRLFDELHISIAFDDFGTGQARLLELVDVQPRYVKFDRAWICGLHQASARRRGLIDRLVQMLNQMKIVTVAEGIECEEDAQACLLSGFTLGQGYHLGRPAAAESFLSQTDD